MSEVEATRLIEGVATDLRHPFGVDRLEVLEFLREDFIVDTRDARGEDEDTITALTSEVALTGACDTRQHAALDLEVLAVEALGDGDAVELSEVVACDELEVLQEVRALALIEDEDLLLGRAPEGIFSRTVGLVGLIDSQRWTLCTTEVNGHKSGAVLEGCLTDLLHTRGVDSRELRIVEEDAISDLRDGSLEGDDTICGGLVDRIGDEYAILDLNLGARDGCTVDGLEVVLLREVSKVSDLVCGDDEVLLFGRAFEGIIARRGDGSTELEAGECRALEGSITDLCELGGLDGLQRLVALEDLGRDLGDFGEGDEARGSDFLLGIG